MAVHDMLMAAAGGTAGAVNYIDDVFSTYLYTGNASTRDILNGIDLSTKGGMVWIKNRGFTDSHNIQDTVRGINSQLSSNTADAAATSGNQIKGFYTNGFQLGYGDAVNRNNYNYVSWTFRKQAKFFDIVTYTGDGSSNRQISHSLGSKPGFIVVKSTSTADDQWRCYHQSLGATKSTLLNLTNPVSTNSGSWNNTEPTSTVFTVSTYCNSNGETYVAYLFAHDAGGFGVTGTDNVISCGSYTGTGTVDTPTVTLGYEPQWLLIKDVTNSNSWILVDNMRGIVIDDNDAYLYPNLTNAESQPADAVALTSTGFKLTGTYSSTNASGSTYIYIAIRRPMKPPTSGTSVFQPTYSYNPTLDTVVTTNFPQDLIVAKKTQFGDSGNTDAYWNWQNRLTGYAPDAYTSPATLFSNSTLSQSSSIAPAYYKITNNTSTIGSFVSGWGNIIYNFKRASGFFDIVCYTGNGTNGTTITHNLTSQPELLIVKKRSNSEDWWVLSKNNGVTWKEGKLNSYNAFTDASPYLFGNGTSFVQPTSTQFTLASGGEVNGSAQTYVAYLFATVAGVSKVGSYTGNGGQGKVIDCGFTGGARFVLIKRTDSNGFGNSNWFVWDTARGIVSGNDPFLRLNTQQIEASDDSIDPNSSGFTVNQDNIDINVNGASYIFLAIA